MTLPYRFYNRFFVKLFFVSINCPSNLHQIISLRFLQLEYSVSRLVSRVSLIKLFFLLTLLRASLWRAKRPSMNQWVLSNHVFGNDLWRFHEKIFILFYAATQRTALLRNFFVNDWYHFNVSGFHTVETAFLEFEKYGLSYSGFLQFHYYFYPLKSHSAFVQRNYLRMLNIPLQRNTLSR